MRTVGWDSNERQLRMIDQRCLPARFEMLTLRTAAEVDQAIRTMAVRGAPAIGVSAAYGVALCACRTRQTNLTSLKEELQQAIRQLGAARPTAVNLVWGLQRMQMVVEQEYDHCEQLTAALIAEAERMADEDVQTNLAMARCGAELIEDGDTIIHHCNTGALATVDWGTALGVIRMAHEQGKKIQVLVDETRPRLQGARLTAWELSQYGIPYHIISDGASGYFLRTCQAQKVLFGADRVAANGDVANKIGSYMLALAAHANDVPVYSVFPLSTVDLSLPSGDHIPIEERQPDEVLAIQYQGEPVIPEGALARNPAFDVTPHTLLSGWVTEIGVLEPPFSTSLARSKAV